MARIELRNVYKYLTPISVVGDKEVKITQTDQAAYGILYDLLAERTPEQSISHKKMPTHSEHIAFVDSKPYKAWYLVVEESEGYVGAVYLSRQNEIGVGIFKHHQGKGYGEAAVRELMRRCPLPEGERYLANVNPDNEVSQAMFEKLGAKVIQYTYEVPPCQ